MDLALSFLNDLRDGMVRAIEHLGYEVPRSSFDAHGATEAYYRLTRRLVSPTPRRCHRSAELKLRVLPAWQARAVLEITGRLARGEDVRAFLSTQTKDLNPKVTHDLLLNDWGLHHLHLGSTHGSTAPGADGYVPRSKDLLYIYVRPKDAYLLDVRDHQAFADVDLVEIMHANWPQVLEPYRCPGVVKILGPTLSPGDTKDLRKAGVAMPIQVRDGTVYVPPGGGYATTGASASAGIHADRLVERARLLATWCERQEGALRDEISRRAGRHLGDLRLQLRMGRRFLEELEVWECGTETPVSFRHPAPEAFLLP